MLQYKNKIFYFKLLHPKGTAELGVIFEISSDSVSDADISETADVPSVSEQPLSTQISQAMESTVMDFMGA